MTTKDIRDVKYQQGGCASARMYALMIELGVKFDLPNKLSNNQRGKHYVIRGENES